MNQWQNVGKWFSVLSMCSKLGIYVLSVQVSGEQTLSICSAVGAREMHYVLLLSMDMSIYHLEPASPLRILVTLQTNDLIYLIIYPSYQRLLSTTRQ